MTKQKSSNNRYGTGYYKPKRLKFPDNKTPRKDSAIGSSPDASKTLVPDTPEHHTCTAPQNIHPSPTLFIPATPAHTAPNTHLQNPNAQNAPLTHSNMDCDNFLQVTPPQSPHTENSSPQFTPNVVNPEREREFYEELLAGAQDEDASSAHGDEPDEQEQKSPETFLDTTSEENSSVFISAPSSPGLGTTNLEDLCSGRWPDPDSATH
jgi:hypothetical protein